MTLNLFHYFVKFPSKYHFSIIKTRDGKKGKEKRKKIVFHHLMASSSLMFQNGAYSIFELHKNCSYLFGRNFILILLKFIDTEKYC